MKPLAAILLVTLTVLPMQHASAQDEKSAETGSPRIMNYWTHLQSILEENEAHRITQSMRPDGRVLRRVNYPFDAVMHLKPAHLLRAAKEGIDFARTAGWGLQPEAAEREAYRNVGVALEYYPLLATSREEFMPLLYDMARRQEDPVLRVFLFDHSMPALALPSLFGRYMQEQVHRLEVSEARPYFLEPATFPLEDPMVQAAAVRALFAYDVRWFTERLNEVPEVVTYAQAAGLEVGPALLLRPDAPQPTGDLGLLMNDIIRSIANLSEHLVSTLGPDSKRPESFKAVAREYLGRILVTFPIGNADAIRAALEAHGGAPATPPAPAPKPNETTPAAESTPAAENGGEADRL